MQLRSTAIDRKTGKPVSEFSNGRYIALIEMTPEGLKVLLDIDNGAIEMRRARRGDTAS